MVNQAAEWVPGPNGLELVNSGEKKADPGEQSPEEVAATLQGLSEGVDTRKTVEFMGKEFRVADKIGLMPLLKFAYSAKQGIDSTDIEGMAAVYEMLRDCIHEDDWGAFQEHATDEKGFVDDLLPVVQQAIQAITARPTGQPSDLQKPSSQNSDGSREDRFKGLVPVTALAE